MRLIALLPLLFVACTVTGGNKLEPEALHQIVVGQTTEAQVIELLGKPMNVVFDGVGGKSMLYHQAIGRPGFLVPKIEQKSASVHINAAGIVDAVDLPEE